MTVLLLCVAALVLLSLVPGPGQDRLSRAFPSRSRGPGRGRGPCVRSRLWERVRRRVRRHRESAGRRHAVIVLCRVLASELRAGQPPGEALRVSAAEAGPAVHRIFDPASMRAAADRDPDLWALAYLAACWEVSADTGAGLAEVVDALAGELAEHEERRAEIAARTAGPRTTAIILGGLPLVGLLMSAGLGGSPLVFLFTTPLGLGCLVGGVALDLLGTWWTLRMVRGAGQPDDGRPRGSPPDRGPTKRAGVSATPVEEEPGCGGRGGVRRERAEGAGSKTPVVRRRTGQR